MQLMGYKWYSKVKKSIMSVSKCRDTFIGVNRRKDVIFVVEWIIEYSSAVGV